MKELKNIIKSNAAVIIRIIINSINGSFILYIDLSKKIGVSLNSSIAAVESLYTKVNHFIVAIFDAYNGLTLKVLFFTTKSLSLRFFSVFLLRAVIAS